jgi:hypothetical protein
LFVLRKFWKALMASRPLWDPDPQTFVALDAAKNKDLRRVRLSDFAVIAFAMNITGGQLTKGVVDIFENVYVRGAVLDPASQKALLERLYDIAGDVLKDDDDGNGDDGDDDGNTGGTGGGAGSGDNDGDTDRGGTSGGGAGNGDDGSHGSAGGGDAASGDGNSGDDGAGGGDAASGDNGGDDGAGGGGTSSGRIGGGEGSKDMGSVKRALDGKETGDAGGEATCGGGGEGHGSSMRKRQKVAVLKVPGLGSEAKAPANVPRGEALKGKGQKARGGGRKGKKAPTSAKFVEPEDDIMEDDLQGDEAMVGDRNDADDNIPTLRGLAGDASV